MRPLTICSVALLASLAGPTAQAQDAARAAEGNPYGVSALWANGDLVSRGTLVALVAMSVATWYVIVSKLVQQAASNTRASKAARKFWAAPTLEEGLVGLDGGAAFGILARAGHAACEHHDPADGRMDRATWISMALDRALAVVAARSQAGLAVLATVASTAPFIGLFGTVWGVYHALTAIGIAGQASLDKVAGPVGEALIMTAMGLAAAVPAVLGYNLLTRLNKGMLDRVRFYAADLHAALLFGRRVEPGSPRRKVFWEARQRR